MINLVVHMPLHYSVAMVKPQEMVILSKETRIHPEETPVTKGGLVARIDTVQLVSFVVMTENAL